MLVSKSDLDDVVRRLLSEDKIGLDVETSGLMEDDNIFSLILAVSDEEFYFNFNPYPGVSDDLVLDVSSTFLSLRPVFESPLKTFYIQNAKFDMRMLKKLGVSLEGTVHCTYAVERLVKNNYFGEDAYRLSGLASRRGFKKDESVEAYITKHKLYTDFSMPGKKRKLRKPHFDQVPFEIIQPYGCQDAKLHRLIGLDQERQIRELSSDARYPSLDALLQNEIKLTKTCFKMERRGIKLDRPLVAKALEYEISAQRKAKDEFRRATGREFEDSRKLLCEVFTELGEAYPLTAAGNPSFASEVLEEMTSPAAQMVNTIRRHDKMAGTYYSSFLYYMDSRDVIHPDMRQAGTETGRFSYRDPNLQNCPKEDEEEDLIKPFHVRECFIPREGHVFLSCDYEQMELKLLFDAAGEMKMIKELNNGADAHQATADICGITRKQAKTINFAIGYGAGTAKIAKSLGVSKQEAHELICDYFARLPKVKPFLTAVSKTGKSRGFIFNPFGRRCYLADPKYSYILPNHFIQGTCADLVKRAMNRVDDYLEPRSSKMILQVHDELLIESPYGDDDIVANIQEIMENAYTPKNGIRMTTSVKYSEKSWGSREMKDYGHHSQDTIYSQATAPRERLATL